MIHLRLPSIHWVRFRIKLAPAFVEAELLLAVTIFALFLVFSQQLRPTPVIAFDKAGKALIFPDTTIETSTTDVRVRRFMSDFIKLYDGVSPRPAEDLTAAYNEMVPRFREILLKQGADQQKIETWKGKNIETLFELDKIEIKGAYGLGSKLSIIGTGRLIYRPAVAVKEEAEPLTRWMFFKAQLIIMPVALHTPNGLLVEFYSSNTFEDPQKLEAYLLQNNIPLTSETGVAK